MATVYVSKSGNDSNNGTAGAPVLTLGKAFDLVRIGAETGSEVIIQDSGVYQEGGLGTPSNNGGANVVVTDITLMALTGSDGLPTVTPTIQGSGSAIQDYALYCYRGWTIKGITFTDWITGEGVIYQRSTGAGDYGLTITLCTFHHITGSCINLKGGNSAANDAGMHTVDGNTFYDFQASASIGAAVHAGGTNHSRQVTVVNNVFYDWKPMVAGGNIIFTGTTNAKRPLNIISHNTFGTSSIGGNVFPTFAVEAEYAKFEYNIIKDQTNATSFAQIDNGEANYNIFHGLAQAGGNAPFGGSAAPTGSTANLNADPILKGPFVGSDANYRLGGTTSPAFDAAIGSTGVSKDRTGGLRATLDTTALNTGIFDIGAYEATGLFSPSSESPDALPQISGDFIINRIPNADNQNLRGLQEGNSSVLGSDVDQVPFTTALNGAIPTFIRKGPSAYVLESGKKTKG
jgi:hypothetical protein